MNNNKHSSELNTVVKVALLLGFAAFYLVSLLTGSVNLYVHPRMVPFMIFAAAVMVTIASVYFFKTISPGVKNDGLRPLLLFIVALLMAWAFPAQAFDAGTGTAGAPQLSAVGGVSDAQPDISPVSANAGNNAAQSGDNAGADSAASSVSETDGGGTVSSEDAGQGGVLVFDSDNYYENLYNIYSDLDAFVGRDVELTGTVFKDDALLDDEFVTARLLMVCCAADMQTVGLLCRWPEAGGLDTDTWVKVTGTLDKIELDGEYIPVVEAKTVEETAMPDIVYIYPFQVIDLKTTQEYRCNICPRRCGAVRTEAAGGGVCGMGTKPVVAKAMLHHWEEPCISGERGSGTVFFTGCALGCVYCQNRGISIKKLGRPVTPERLREIYFELIGKGAHNISLVTPTHFTDGILTSLEGGLPVPVVYNTGGYDSVETLRRFEGKVRIYLPDLKYALNGRAARYSAAPDYPEAARQAIREMFRQTGPYALDQDGLLQRGVVIRHLVLPENLENTFRVIDWAAETFSPGDVLFSLMSQYTPYDGADEYPELRRRLTQSEYYAAKRYLEDSGIEDGFYQELSSAKAEYIPDFDLGGV